MKHLTTALKLLAILTALVGIIYPVSVTALAQLFFPKEAGGSLFNANSKLNVLDIFIGSFKFYDE